jgi:hypothetical protein
VNQAMVAERRPRSLEVQERRVLFLKAVRYVI